MNFSRTGFGLLLYVSTIKKVKSNRLKPVLLNPRRDVCESLSELGGAL
jgi:hypothetical protein